VVSLVGQGWQGGQSPARRGAEKAGRDCRAVTRFPGKKSRLDGVSPSGTTHIPQSARSSAFRRFPRLKPELQTAIPNRVTARQSLALSYPPLPRGTHYAHALCHDCRLGAGRRFRAAGSTLQPIGTPHEGGRASRRSKARQSAIKLFPSHSTGFCRMALPTRMKSGVCSGRTGWAKPVGRGAIMGAFQRQCSACPSAKERLPP